MNTSTFVGSFVAATALAGALSPALALDAYRDRRGLYYGAGVDIAIGKADTEGAENEVGFGFRGRVGGGVTTQLTLDAELGYNLLPDADTGLVTGFLGANFFLVDGLYVRGFGGAAHVSPDAGESETGLAAGVGVGYEFFANADLAVGVGARFENHFYDKFDFRVVTFGVTALLY